MEHVNVIIDKKYFQNENQNSISIDKFTAKIGPKVLFDDSPLKLTKGIYGLIGKNGCGKSTLLMLLKNNKIPVNKNWNTLYLEQEIEETDKNPLMIVLQSNDKLASLKKRKDILNKILESGDYDENDDEFFEELDEVEQEIKIYNEEKEVVLVKKILSGLGFTEEMQHKPSNTFSGGWKMRISLARSLYIQPDLLLMDEPTNHLDLEAIIWLTDYLENYNKNKVIVLVSHNIGFLNNVCDYIMNIENNKLHSYKGNYYQFKKMRMNKEREIFKKWNKFQKKIKGFKKKGMKNKDIDKLMVKEGVIKPKLKKDSKFEFYNYPTDSNNIVTVNNLTFSYDENIIFNDTDFGIRSNSKIILVGKNGCGKSTLMKIMSGNIPHNNVSIKSGIRIGVYDQHFENTLPLDTSPVDYLANFVPNDIKGDPKFISRGFLGKVRLEPEAHLKKMSQLSGGQKARVAIVKLIFSRPHLLILDEPTNHLDIETVECLIEALDNYQGAFMIITHERHLIEELEDDIELFLIENKKIIKYKKEFSDYCNKIINSIPN